MGDNLKQKAAKGIVWKFIDQGGIQLIQFASGIYIARILSPEDYGLIGMMAIFIGISQLFIDSGFRSTLIQKGSEVTPDHYNVVFLFNLTTSILFYLIIYFGAPYIATFYDEQRLILLSRILSINIIIISLGTIHQTILEKKLNFRTLAKIRLVSSFFAVIIGVVLARLEFSYWALVSMAIAENTIRTILFWITNGWTPKASFNIPIFKELFAKSIQIFSAGFLQTIVRNIYTVIIGKFFSPADVGFYDQGNKLQKRISEVIMSSFQSVMFPIHALMKDDIPRLKNSIRKNVRITTRITFPAIIGLIIVAQNFIQVLMTEKWLPSVFYIQVLSLASLVLMLRWSVNSHLLPSGRFKLILKVNASLSILFLLIIGIVLIFQLGIKILVLGKLLHEIVGFGIVIYFAKKHINYNFMEILRDFIPSLFFSLIMGAAVWLIGFQLETSLLTLTAQIVAGVSIYIILNYWFDKSLFSEIKSMLNKGNNDKNKLQTN